MSKTSSCSLKNAKVFSEIITDNSEMLLLFEQIQSIVVSSQPVLITGETGVGKELIARSVHAVRPVTGPMVAVNVAGLDDNMFSDTLFGHVKGAFTGADQTRKGLIEQAAGGTLFLDEIGNLCISSQVKLLRLIQEREYLPLGSDQCRQTDVCIVAATNADLWNLQKAGKFRQDLNFRLRTHHIHIPPLRERTDDIPLLLEHFLDKAADNLNKAKPVPPRELLELLQTYTFPGNVRELEDMIFDAVSRHNSNILSLDVFKSRISQGRNYCFAEAETDDAYPFTLFKELPSIKRATELLVAEAVKRAKGNQSAAARMLGISQPALSKRLKNGNNLK